MQEMQVQALGVEDTLEKKMTTHSSLLPREIPQTEELDGLDRVTKESDMIKQLNSNSSLKQHRWVTTAMCPNSAFCISGNPSLYLIFSF